MHAKTILFLIIVLIFIACMTGYKCMSGSSTSSSIDGFSGCTSCKSKN